MAIRLSISWNLHLNVKMSIIIRPDVILTVTFWNLILTRESAEIHASNNVNTLSLKMLVSLMGIVMAVNLQVQYLVTHIGIIRYLISWVWDCTFKNWKKIYIRIYIKACFIFSYIGLKIIIVIQNCFRSNW
jgi:hypothetical protein